MPNEDKPDPLDDVKKGLGLLFRAARTAVKNLPTDPIEKVVIEGAREVGRAVENVASSIEKEVFGKRGEHGEANADAPKADASAEAPKATDAPKADAPKGDAPNADTKPDDAPKGPRVS